MQPAPLHRGVDYDLCERCHGAGRGVTPAVAPFARLAEAEEAQEAVLSAAPDMEWWRKTKFYE
jgi:hypothetical protein